MNPRAFSHLAIAVTALLLTACHPFEDLSQYEFGGPDGCIPAESCPSGDCEQPICTLQDTSGDSVEPGDTTQPPDDTVEPELPPDAVEPDVAEPCGGQCGEGETCCSETCVTLSTSSEHCGTCGTSCFDTEACTNGSCELICEAGLTACDGSCVNLLNDNTNCGVCGVGCPEGQGCEEGLCTCDFGTADCDADPTTCEIDITSDKSNCGACGEACHIQKTCVDGTCLCGEVACAEGQTCCDGSDGVEICIDLQNDPLNCGQCQSACNPGEICREGACRCGITTGCAEGNVCCSGECAPAGTECQCGNTTCAVGQGCCSEACVDLLNDESNCGECGAICTGEEICKGGVCGCEDPNAALCGERCVDTSADAQNCGACGNVCGDKQECCKGSCKDLPSDIRNCGGCGITCGRNEICDQGTCACFTGFEDCDEDPSNGCEVNLNLSTRNCGGCGETCAANQTCDVGSCRCKVGYADCNKDLGDGCESDLSTGTRSPDGATLNCGRCGNTCKLEQTCQSGFCINNELCSTDMGNCDGDLTNGCETDLSTGALKETGTRVLPTYTHCGACRFECRPGESCVNGACVCPSGSYDCVDFCWQAEQPVNDCTSRCDENCGAATGICYETTCACCSEVVKSTDSGTP